MLLSSNRKKKLSMGKYFLGAISSSDRETRILRLKAYLNTTHNYRSDTALEQARIKSWPTMVSYLNVIKHHPQEYELTPLGQENYKIAIREAEFLKSVRKYNK